MVEFKQLNLASAWPAMPPLDLALVRNVLIYFNPETKKDILARARKALRPDGVLVLGTGETTFNLCPQLERVPLEGACCYQPVRRG
jgi:chemotaxis protein methyltransferase CheR